MLSTNQTKVETPGSLKSKNNLGGGGNVSNPKERDKNSHSGMRKKG
jgi:hypothetical protein